VGGTGELVKVCVGSGVRVGIGVAVKRGVCETTGASVAVAGTCATWAAPSHAARIAIRRTPAAPNRNLLIIKSAIPAFESLNIYHRIAVLPNRHNPSAIGVFISFLQVFL
jgi:hypothetical protein